MYTYFFRCSKLLCVQRVRDFIQVNFHQYPTLNGNSKFLIGTELRVPATASVEMQRKFLDVARKNGHNPGTPPTSQRRQKRERQEWWNVGDEVDACWGQNRVWYAGTILEIHQTKNGSTRYTVGEFENDDPADVGATYVSLYSFFSTASYYCCQRLVCLCAVVSINPLFF